MRILFLDEKMFDLNRMYNIIWTISRAEADDNSTESNDVC